MLLTRAIIHNMRNHPKKLAVINGKYKYTHEQFADRVSRVKQALQDLGLVKGDRIALLMHNDHRYLELFYAAASYGVIIVPINTRLNVKEIIWTLNDTTVAAIFIHKELLPILADLKREVGSLNHYILAEDEDVAVNHRELISYENILEEQSDEILTIENVNDDDIVGIYYTGGTTGRPKGVIHTNKSMVSAANMFVHANQCEENDIYLHAAPMFHLADLGNTHSITLLGGTHTFVRMFDVAEVLKAFQELKPTTGTFVPTMINMIVNHPDIDKYDVSSVKRIVYGGSAMPIEVLKKASVKMPGVKFIECYGMTESSAALCNFFYKNQHIFEGRDSQKMSSSGRPFIGVEMKIVDKNGQEVRVGEVGEIIAQGPNFTKGYWNNPEATAEALRDGWYYTGDMAYRDEENYFYIVDRAKDMIITGGENVYSTEVENVLYDHPSVLECAVIGVPDDQWGEAVTAIIVPRPDAQPSQEEIKDFAREYLANYKVPKKVEFVTELPKSGSGKLLRYKLREQYVSESPVK